jgi:predicted metalloprotease
MKVTLTANQEYPITTTESHVALALISGEISYARGVAVSASSPTLNEDIRTDYVAMKTFTTLNVKAGASGAVFQFRGE